MDNDADKDFKARLFGDLNVLSVFYGESQVDPIAVKLVDKCSAARPEDIDVAYREALFAGMYVVMVQTFDFLLDRNLDAEGLYDYLESLKGPLEYVCHPGYIAPDVYSGIFNDLVRTANLDDGLMLDYEHGKLCWFPVKAGERLTCAHFSLGQIPGQRISA